MENRETFRSRIGFLLVSAGCAIGIGNVWKFPYVAGKNGGGLFVLFYLIFLALLGIPVLTMELSIGRASGKTIVQGYKALEKKGHKWHIHGYFCLAASCLLMMYYTTVAGWMLAYFWKYVTGAFTGVRGEGIADVFGQMLGNPAEMLIFMGIVVVTGFLVISFGVKNGLEQVNKYMMIVLLMLIVVLAGKSVTLKNAGEGIRFYLLPDISAIKETGIFNIITAAMNQAFFTLSIGAASMVVFGSYMSKDDALPGEAVKIGALDTFVAIVSGLIIFPACFSFGIEPDEGPSLIFITLPCVFADMNGGRIWGALFFLFMTFASFSTVTAVFENLVGSLMDNFNISRVKSVLINAVAILVLSIPCVLGFNLWSEIRILGMGILEFEDFLVSNLLLPIGSLVFVLFSVYNFGWGADNFLTEANTGKGLKFGKALIPYFRFVLPVLILVIIITGLFF